MSEQIIINSLEFAQQAHEIHGRIAPLDLERLADVLVSQAGELRYSLVGGRDSQGGPELRLSVDGELELICQRCLQPMFQAVKIDARFIVVGSENQLPAPEEEPDDAEFLVADPHMNVVALIEDEVLLALPLASVHENCESAGAQEQQAQEQKESPFKVLQGLKLVKK